MTIREWLRYILGGVMAGLLLGWLLPRLIGPLIQAYALTLRDSPRVSDAMLGAGSLGVYLAEAPSVYLGLHATAPTWSPAIVNAISWALIGLVVGALVAASRRAGTGGAVRTHLLIGALGGLLLGWMVPALCRALGECFVHCYMHEGLLGTLALIGGTALRTVGSAAELPWRLIFGGASAPPVTAMLLSAVVWAVIGAIAVIALTVARRGTVQMHVTISSPDPAEAKKA